MNKYLVQPILKFLRVAGKLESFELQLSHAFNDQEIEHLLWNEVSEISHNKFIIGVNSFSELVNKRVLGSFFELFVICLNNWIDTGFPKSPIR